MLKELPPRDVNLLTWLTSDKYRDKVLADQKNGKMSIQQKILKKTLPCIIPAGRFSYRRGSQLIEHSGFLPFDIDFQDNGHVTNFDDLKTQISHIKNVAYCGLSVRGNGFWGLIPIPKSTAEEHKLKI